jgi:integrase
MARKTTQLTNTEVKQAKPRDKEYSLADGEGLYLRIKPNGSKLWLFNYQHPVTKKRNNLSLGSYPALSIAKARELRKAAREQLANKIDPKSQREEIQAKKLIEQQNTLRAVTLLWLETKKARVSPGQVINITNSFKNHIFPKLGVKPINELTAPMVIAVIKKVENKGSFDLAKRLCARINEVMKFAVNTGMLESNVLTGIGSMFAPPVVTHRATVKPEQLSWLLKKINIANIKIVTRCLIEWQMHSMVRPSEAAGATWQEIDLDKGVWKIPAERMKMKLPHLVPLTAQMLKILELLKSFHSHSNYLFPSYKHSQGHLHKETVNNAFKRMGLQGIQTAHGLRSLASTALNDQGFDYDVIEAALAHIDQNEVRRAYNHSDYLVRRKVIMTWWSDHIEQAAIGNISLSATNNKGLSIVNA